MWSVYEINEKHVIKKCSNGNKKKNQYLDPVLWLLCWSDWYSSLFWPKLSDEVSSHL